MRRGLLLISLLAAMIPFAGHDANAQLGAPTVEVLHVVIAGQSPRFDDMNTRIPDTMRAVEQFVQSDVGRRLRIADGYTTVTVTNDTLGGMLSQIQAQGFNDPNRIYVDFIESAGTGGSAPCGQMAARHAMLYMPACEIYPFNNAQWPGGGSYLVLHELLHALGAVATCAPNSSGDGHSTDLPTDVLSAIGRDWDNLTIDPGNDDYYGHSIPGCPDIEDSPYWMPGTIGDVNCDDKVDIVDALVLAQFTVKIRTDVAACSSALAADQANSSVGDIDFSGTADIVDALLIARCVSGIEDLGCPP